MDLLRTAKSAFEVSKPLDQPLCSIFLTRALKDLEKHFPNETVLKTDLAICTSQINELRDDSLERIRWGEKVMTIAARLGTN